MNAICHACRARLTDPLVVPKELFSPPLIEAAAFFVCIACRSEGICPQCLGSGRVSYRSAGGSEVESCDLCGGSGEFDYRLLR
jgi:hypothetical protein